ncbi:MAG: damage-inducible protein DinB [Afipia sp.]|nr:damage-inducible protein DinB [Afipia sp.]
MMRPAYVQRMARYNRWQNESLYNAADRLSDEERRLDRGAFFKSIHATLSHLLWADSQWMARFENQERPPGGIKESVSLWPDWDDMKAKRAAMDERILNWSRGVNDEFLGGEIAWFSGSAQRDVVKPASEIMMHFFNHQTHHRGQVHAMLTQAGAKPGDTDLWLMPE